MCGDGAADIGIGQVGVDQARAMQLGRAGFDHGIEVPFDVLGGERAGPQIRLEQIGPREVRTAQRRRRAEFAPISDAPSDWHRATSAAEQGRRSSLHSARWALCSEAPLRSASDKIDPGHSQFEQIDEG